MNKQVGLWIDHRKAVIVLITDEGEEVKKITSNMEKHVRFAGEDGQGEDVRDVNLGTISITSTTKSSLLFVMQTPSRYLARARQKVSWKNVLRTKGLKARILAIETVDKMTNSQISAKVREHFLAESAPEKVRQNTPEIVQ